MKEIFLTNKQARQFMLLKQGLLSKHKFSGKQGVLEFIRQAGCVQFDPVDICGKNAEIILHSRVKGFRKEFLEELLYKDRLLVDYPDKQLSIIPTENWQFFERFREKARKISFENFEELAKTALNFIEENGAVSSSELPIEGKIAYWFSAIHWSGGSNTNAARAVLEQLYSMGELVIHHKKGTRKFYDLAKKYIPPEILNAPDPLPNDYDFMRWRVKRRIGAVGLLWNKNSHAWLNIHELTPGLRTEIMDELAKSGEIIPVTVEKINAPLFLLSEDEDILEKVLTAPKNAFTPRTEFIAPLDSFMWDRNLIKTLFNFHYQWEIYTPPVKRKFGAYTLPLLHSDALVGRVDIAREKKTLVVKNIWLEDGIRNTKKLQAELSKTLKRFAKFNGCEEISISRDSNY